MAESFTHLGSGEGFILNGCVYRQDVSGYDYWTTFSGTKKTSPVATEEKIYESHKLAMKMQWLSKKINGNCTWTRNVNTDDPVTKTVTAAEQGYDTYDRSDPLANPVTTNNPWPPKDRVCGLDREWDCIPNPDPFFPDSCYRWEQVQILTGATQLESGSRLQVFLRPHWAVTAMYNGDTSNINNFVGYGGRFGRSWDISNGSGVASSYANSSSNCFCSAQFCGYCDDLPENQQDNKVQSAGYTTVGDFSVVGLAMHVEREVKNQAGEITLKATGTANGSGATATANYKRRFRNEGSDPPTYSLKTVETAAASVSSIDYYTI